MSDKRRWTAERIPDQSKRVFVVTGANSGLGLATTRALAHPGYTSTNLRASSPVGMVRFVFGRLLRPLAQSPDRGALSQLYAATAPDVEGGQFIGPDGMGELRGAPKRVEPAPRAADAATGRRLWELSEDLTSVRFGFPAPA